jgi:type I restriction enzyme, S subunit
MQDSWEKIPLGELFEFGSGLSKPRADFGSGFGFLSFKDVFYNYFVPDKLEQLVNSTEKEQKTCSIKRGDVFLTRTSETQEDLGMSCVALKDYDRATFNGFTKRLRPKFPDRIVPEYAAYFFRSNLFRQDITAMSSLSTRASLNNEMLGRLKMLLPPVEDQKAIGRVLKSLDNKIELNRRMNATLEAMARALFKAWFVDFEPVRANMQNRPSNSASPEIAKLFPSEFENGIPKGWELQKLGELVNVVKGRSYTSKELSESDNALVTLKSFIRGGGYKSNGLKPFTGTFKPEQRIEDGEIIVACTDVTQAAEVIGRAALFQSNHEFENHVASLDVQIVRPKEPGSSLFYYHLMRSDDYVSHILSYTSGTTVLHLAKDAIQCYEGLEPGKKLVRVYSNLVNPFFEKIRLNQNEGKSLSKLRDSLLPRLISGRLKIGEVKPA